MTSVIATFSKGVTAVTGRKSDKAEADQ